MKCIYCCEEIKEQSKEHIIQSALGSTFASKKLLCKACNNYFANDDSGKVDDSLIKQFNFFRNIFNIWGDRNTKPPIIYDIELESGDLIDLAPGGIPFKSKTIREIIDNIDGSLEIKIQTKDIEKAKEQLFHLKKQFGEENLILNSAMLEKYFLEEKIHSKIEIGGDIALLAVLKNLYNFLHYLIRDKSEDIRITEKEKENLRQLIRYKQQIEGIKASVDFLNIPPIKMEQNDIGHYLILVGDKAKKILYGYFIVFGNFNFTAMLSQEYCGNDFCLGFKQDPRSNEKKYLNQIEKNDYSPEITLNYKDHAHKMWGLASEKIGNLMRIYFEYLRKELINDIIDSSFKNNLGAANGEIILPI